MTDEQVWQDLRPYVYTEAAFVVMTCFLGFIGWWPVFAASALLCVLLPIWITAVAAVVIAAHVGDMKGK